MHYRIKNWDHFQHYRDRNPPWIKLHYELLSSSDWVTLDDAGRVLAVACMLIASRSKGEIDGSEAGLAYLKRVAYLNKPPNLKPLISCGFLVMLADASALQANDTQETEAYKERHIVKEEIFVSNKSADADISRPPVVDTPDEWKPVETHLRTLHHLNRPQLYDWKFWARIDEAYKEFPDLSICDELSKAEAWLIANPRKAATKTRWTQFILNWFTRATERKARYEKGQPQYETNRRH